MCVSKLLPFMNDQAKRKIKMSITIIGDNYDDDDDDDDTSKKHFLSLYGPSIK